MSKVLIISVLLLVVVTVAAERQVIPATKRDLQQLLRSTANHDVARSLGENYLNDFAVDGLETSYDEYSQAWRMLGMYIDCGDDNDEIYNSQEGDVAAGRRRNRRHQRQRRTEQAENGEGEPDEGNEGQDGAEGEDEAPDDQNNEQQDVADNNNNNEEQKNCKRYLLWAAVSSICA
jgi:hypothetical protein